MSKIKVAIVIPAYKDELNDFEKISLNQVQKVLGNHPIIFIAPDGKNFSYIPKNRQIISIPAEYFKSVSGYNNLLLDAGFYRTFLECEYILIYQLDAFVFKDELEYFCSLNYDYIGAAWPLMIAAEKNIFGKKIKPRVGNGGFSLRKVQSCFELTKKYKSKIESFENQIAEDVIFSIFGSYDENFKIAPINVANKFSAECLPSRILKKNRGEIFFGCHAWTDYSADFWLEIFKIFGFDLKKFKTQMQSKDLDGLFAWLTIFAIERFKRRVEKNLPLARYIPDKNFFAVRVLDNHDSKKIFQNLCEEDKTFGKNFKFYTGEELPKLLADLKISGKKNNLIITTGFKDDDFVISALKKNNVKVKDNFVFFHKEYLKTCEKIFHNLGK